MSPTIELLIAPDGSSRLETTGFSGPHCRDVSRFLEQALGQSAQDVIKPEFYQTSCEAESVRQQV